MATHPFDALIARAASLLTARLSRASAPTAPAPDGAGHRRGKSPLKGKKLDMSCRVAGCKNKSGGPRLGFMCEKHQKLPKKAQQAAREAWKASHA
jgi:hypothetical protein